MNLNKAFQNVVGATSRSLFGRGRKFSGWKSSHGSIARGQLSTHRIQCIPLREDLLDIVEPQVSETTGEFVEGKTILTLHFKRA